MAPLLQTIRSKLSELGKLNPKAAEMGRSVLLPSLIMTALLLGIGRLGVLQGMNLAAYDHLIRLRPDQGEDDRLLIVGITEADIQTRQEWPVSDQTLAQLLEKLEAQQPRAIGLDIIRDVPIQPGREALLNQMQQSDRLITVCKVSAPNNPGFPPPPGVAPEFVGFSDLVIDPGGILRRSLLVIVPPLPENGVPLVPHLCSQPTTLDNQPNTLLSFGFQLALTYLAEEGIQPELTEADELKLGSTLLSRLQPTTGGYQKADASGYQILLDYRSANRAAPQVSITDVLSDRVNSELIRDRIVLIGYTTPQAKDEFYTPYSAGASDSQKMPGVVVHAQSVSQILSAVLDDRPLLWSWSNAQEGIWIFGWALVGGVVAWYVRHPLKFGGAIAIASGVIYGICFLLFLQGGWIPLVPGAIALVVTSAAVILVDRFNHSTYGQTVCRQVKSFLKLDIEINQAKLEKQVAEITESDYFQDLQQKAKDLRSSAGTRSPTAPSTENSIPTTDHIAAPSPTEPTVKSGDENELDYFQKLRLKSKRLRDQRQGQSDDKEGS
ncbi:CHASE2 domain-containing protein [Leptolyngbya sp. FACHB-541]|uniref:CHASE2 domain-containing protein n=1 Tax=Leptolyngbya sp. FACHB-541 TaxID=2692810 RepID=UPI001683E3DC|nr:CHASE2 domain-containing protein [Leptolyngbya sp. FACHB-541]MBD1995749.1 CHASE2 domain-containing protein [Leptolyngbya sp. FACHB-541]